MLVLGLTGPARAGKDTVCDILAEKAWINRISFAAPIRGFVAHVCGFSSLEELDANKNVPHMIFGKTPRMMMQTLGTEWGREMIYQDIWLKVLEGQLESNTLNIITDVRFENEAQLIQQHNGIIWRVERENLPHTEAHISEEPIPEKYINAVIKNDGTLDDLRNTVADTWENLMTTVESKTAPEIIL